MTDLNIYRRATAQYFLPLLLALGVLIPVNRAFSTDERQLSFYHTHTQQVLQITYAAGGVYLRPSLLQINEFLADFRTGDEIVMDPELLDILYDARQQLGGDGTYEVISAYRSPATNDMLRSRSGGVAKNSQHLLGKAIDVRLRGADSRTLRDTAIGMRRGGVGYYEDSDFVHIDTGPVRQW
jgi:uncharacterized protein YcbK (DUF882 family)